ncbi:MAG: ATP-dependent zinc metalloprotease FtsH [Candidatus Binataceae bacterium]
MESKQKTGKPGKPGNPPQRQIPPSLWVLWLIFSGWLVWNSISQWRKPSTEVEIPYSALLTQVRTDNVSQVQIAEAEITGQFVKPVLWPEPKPKAEEKVEHPAIAPKPKAEERLEHPAIAPKPKAEEKLEHLAVSPKQAPVAAASNPAPKAAAPKPAPAAAEQKPIAYSKFRTVFPATVGDPNLMPLLESHRVVVDVANTSHSWLVEMLIAWGPMLLLIGFFWWMSASAGRSQAGMFGFGRMKLRRYTSDQPKVTFADVAGAQEAKAELQEEVDFLKHPKRYHDIGARIPKGVLLVGPPGTGKTLLARAVAGEAEVPFFSINASEFVQMFVGVGASRVRDLFRQAKEAAPAIVFIDELDAVGRRRGAGVGTVNDEREQTLNQLLGELDGFDPRAEVIILAATNRPDVLDPALLRPGRFDRQVVVGPPNREGREGILRIHSRKLRLASDVDLVALSASTIGLSGADLANLCNEAALVAARHQREQVTMADFEEASDKVRLGAAQAQLVDPAERRIVAYHESGHAVVAWLTPGADPVQKVTIVPHGQALGLTQQVPATERHNLSRSYLMTRLAVMLGGRTAEEVVFGEITTGAESDLVQATGIARRMVARWGMGNLGLVVYQTDEQQPFLGYELARGHDYSEATAARIDREIQEMLEQVHQQVRHLLTDARARLDEVVETLLQHETVSHDDLQRILGPRAQAAVQPIEPGASAHAGLALVAKRESAPEPAAIETRSPEAKQRGPLSIHSKPPTT